MSEKLAELMKRAKAATEAAKKAQEETTPETTPKKATVKAPRSLVEKARNGAEHMFEGEELDMSDVVIELDFGHTPTTRSSRDPDVDQVSTQTPTERVETEEIVKEVEVPVKKPRPGVKKGTHLNMSILRAMYVMLTGKNDRKSNKAQLIAKITKILNA